MKFHVFGRLKRGEENSISKIVFYDLHIRIPCRWDQENRKISVIYTLTSGPVATYAAKCENEENMAVEIFDVKINKSTLSFVKFIVYFVLLLRT